MDWKSGHSHGARYIEAAFIITVGLLNKQLNFKQATPQWFKNNEHCNCLLKKTKTNIVIGVAHLFWSLLLGKTFDRLWVPESGPQWAQLMTDGVL